MTNARASERRWRWPPDRRTPWSPICGVIAVGKRGDEVVRLRQPGGARSTCIVARAVEAERDIGADRAVEQRGALRHDADLAAQILDLERGDIRPSRRIDAAVGIEEAQQQIDQRGLARAIVADQRDLFARP